jgi:hypothetical protein
VKWPSHVRDTRPNRYADTSATHIVEHHAWSARSARPNVTHRSHLPSRDLREPLRHLEQPNPNLAKRVRHELEQQRVDDDDPIWNVVDQ